MQGKDALQKSLYRNLSDISDEELDDLSEAYEIREGDRESMINAISERMLARDEAHGYVKSVSSLKGMYLKHVISRFRDEIIPRPANCIRIATFNVHFFTDVYEEENTYFEILRDLYNLNADIIVLQEIVLGGKIKINPSVTVDASNLFEDFDKLNYHKVVTCNSVPSWFSSIYGNMMLIDKGILNRVCPDKPMVCEVLDENTVTFSKASKSVTVSGSHAGTKETRCVIKIKIPFNGRNIFVYGTHLDVADEDTRLEQIIRIADMADKDLVDSNDTAIICGDFNTLDPEQYKGTEAERFIRNSPFLRTNGKVTNYLKTHGFIDMFGEEPPLMTSWNTMRVDFMFVKGRAKFYPHVYYTDSSDHIPLYVDIEV